MVLIYIYFVWLSILVRHTFENKHFVACTFGVQIGLRMPIYSLNADDVGWHKNKIIVDKLK